MPRYDATKLTAGDFPMRCRIYDGAGAEALMCVVVDTDTGEVERADLDAAGKLRFDRERMSVATVKETRPRPFTFVPTGAAGDGDEPVPAVVFR